MSLQAKIFELIKDVPDPMMRIDVASTISFLADIYILHSADEDEIFKDLVDVCLTVINLTRPDLEENEKRDLAEKKARDLLTTIKMRGMTRRMASKYTGMRL